MVKAKIYGCDLGNLQMTDVKLMNVIVIWEIYGFKRNWSLADYIASAKSIAPTRLRSLPTITRFKKRLTLIPKTRPVPRTRNNIKVRDLRSQTWLNTSW